MSYHKYDIPEQPHDMGSTSTGVALLIGLLMVVLVVAGFIGYVLGQIMMWVLSL